MQSEKQLQAELIIKFGIQHPELRHLLFEVNNDTFSKNHAIARLARGMVPGVSDLVFINPYTGVITGIELKAPETRHDSKHILCQLNWGAKLKQAGGVYLLAIEITDILAYCKAVILKQDVSDIINENEAAQFEIRLLAEKFKTVAF